MSTVVRKSSWHFVFILGQALPAHLVSCWWVGWWLWHAGCISQESYLLYFFIYSVSIYLVFLFDENSKCLYCTYEVHITTPYHFMYAKIDAQIIEKDIHTSNNVQYISKDTWVFILCVSLSNHWYALNLQGWQGFCH